MTDTTTLWDRAIAATADMDRTLPNIRGQMVRIRREDLGITQSALAIKAGIATQQAISRIEKGTQNPTDAQRVAIARALGMRAGELFAYADELEMEL